MVGPRHWVVCGKRGNFLSTFLEVFGKELHKVFENMDKVQTGVCRWLRSWEGSVVEDFGG